MTAASHIPGFIVAAPSSGSGKTIVTLALLRAFRRRGLSIGSFKTGPDYIDPAFHAAATGRSCVNIDLWAMRPGTVSSNLRAMMQSTDMVIGEGVMGLFDGATDGTGATADVAAHLSLPVVLIVDASGQSTSAAAIVHGFDTFRPDLRIAGVIFNKVGSPRHAAMLTAAMAERATPVLGCLPRMPQLDLPERHLGLVQASEHEALETFLNAAADSINTHIDLDQLAGLGHIAQPTGAVSSPPIPPLGQRIALARDQAFAFAYPHILEGWHKLGANLLPFSPLADEAPPACDAIYLPGGYPELHAGRLAANTRFLDGIRTAAQSGIPIFGECGGYMVLGKRLTDADGVDHEMAGLLPLETSFAERRLHLGYRDAALETAHSIGEKGARFKAHEFHYATIVREEGDRALFKCRDSYGADLGTVGSVVGCVAGSFLHLIDQSD